VPKHHRITTTKRGELKINFSNSVLDGCGKIQGWSLSTVSAPTADAPWREEEIPVLTGTQNPGDSSCKTFTH
jgi:hypothetical protein